MISDPKASAIHARIKQSEEGSWALEDNNSKNGTWVGGERISACSTDYGLIFNIGNHEFEVIEVKEETVSPPPSIRKAQTLLE